MATCWVSAAVSNQPLVDDGHAQYFAWEHQRLFHRLPIQIREARPWSWRPQPSFEGQAQILRLLSYTRTLLQGAMESSGTNELLGLSNSMYACEMLTLSQNHTCPNVPKPLET